MKTLAIAFTVGMLATLPAASAEESSKVATRAGGIEIGDLISAYAKRTGKPFVIDPRVRAQVSLAGMDPAQLTQEQFLAILDAHQLALAEVGAVLTVVPDAGARQLATRVVTDPGFKALDHEIVTLLVQPKKVCAAMMVPVLRPLMPQAAHLAAEIQTNTLIINDRAVNVRRIATLVRELDGRGRGDAANCEAPRKPD
jgi:general secretion pathway protein D